MSYAKCLVYFCVGGLFSGLTSSPLGAAPAATVHVGQSAIPYVHPTVREPIPDGVSLTIPAELSDKTGAPLGMVDVTKAPFNADPTGQKDSTKALQRAIDFARDYQMVCFFPAGTYRVSDTLSCIQNRYQRSNGKVLGGHLFPCMLAGSRAGKERARIVLASNSPGFNDPAKPKMLLYFWARGYGNPTKPDLTDAQGPEEEQPNISMNQVLVNLDLVIGEGNSGAIALRHQAAEGSAVEDCTIDATHGYIGIQGGIGSGGSSAGVTVIGGKIGLDFTGTFSGTQPTPVITGFTLRGQTGVAIRSTSRQALVAPGLKIIGDKITGPLIDIPVIPSQPNNGQLAIIDGVIEFTGGAGVAIASARSVYLENVYVKNAASVVQTPDKHALLPGNAKGWLQIKRYAEPGEAATGKGFQYRYPVYVNGQVKPGALTETVAGVAPSEDLQGRHLWRADFPGCDTPGVVNVKAPPYSAKGDGRTDDTAALQKAINEHEIVFLPKGYYRLSRTLELAPKTKLIGAGQHLSVLIATAAEGDFANPAKPSPLVRTADAAGAETVLAFCGLYAATDLPGVFALHWRSGGKSILRSVDFNQHSVHGFTLRKGEKSEPVLLQHPMALITGHGGGAWYNFRASSSPHGRNYRHLLIQNTQEPLSFYQLSPQHVVSDYAVELRGAKQVSIFGTKDEGNQPMILARQCDYVRFIGHGGNAKGLPGNCLFRVEETPHFTAACLVDGPTKTGTGQTNKMSGFSTDPRQWFMLIEKPSGGSEIKTAPQDRPVLYLRN